MAKFRIPKYDEITASPFKRIGAFLIDLLILQVFVMSAFSGFFERNFPRPEDGFAQTYAFISTHKGLIMDAYYVMIAMAAIMIIYFSYMEYRYSQTIGKMLFRIKIIATEKEAPTLYQCILRNIYLLPIFPLFLLWIIDPLYMFFSGQRLSEAITKTKTVEALQ